MSLALEYGTKPHGLRVHTLGFRPEIVEIGDYQLSIEDFLLTAFYVLTNTNLTNNDQRLQFVKSIQNMHVVEQPRGDYRLESDTIPIRVNTL